MGGVARWSCGRANFLNRRGGPGKASGPGLFHRPGSPVPIRLDLRRGTEAELELFWTQAEARLLFTQSSRIT